MQATESLYCGGAAAGCTDKKTGLDQRIAADGLHQGFKSNPFKKYLLYKYTQRLDDR